uniref:Uncharacterized protein n=1 Tax=Nelumbo nucifera TaxID=4432 RepID=A0A822YDU3_NELNU|nr:TPA_asm: hypothetical protein HUJ06_009164 [Nelumbo nucifera]
MVVVVADLISGLCNSLLHTRHLSWDLKKKKPKALGFNPISDLIAKISDLLDIRLGICRGCCSQ